MTVELPRADGIPEKLLADFKQNTRPLLAELDRLDRYDGRLEVADHDVGSEVLMALGGDTGEDSTR
ncbi:MAG: hypothetical protein U5P41_11885 [Gammaproteobacteria bacterium]|nr:hypothetical protein [Gammaproteobacteria bacterium]